jgi:hypothetical protein
MDADAIKRAKADSEREREEILKKALEPDMFDPALAKDFEESIRGVCLAAETGVNRISPETGQAAVDAASVVHKIGERIGKRKEQ